MNIELAAEIRRRANSQCECCRLPQAAFSRPFHIEHIVAKQHGGRTQLENLALACWYCNLKKGPNLTGIDPDSKIIVSLFHPRTDHWSHHFALSPASGSPPGIEVKGLTQTGRATARVLGMNDPMRRILRYELSLEARLPPRE